MYYEAVAIDDAQQIVNAFCKYFKSIYAQGNRSTAVGSDNMSNVILNNNCLHLSHIFNKDVSRAIKKMQAKGSSGPDFIPSFLIKDYSSCLVTPLVFLFYLILKSSVNVNFTFW